MTIEKRIHEIKLRKQRKGPGSVQKKVLLLLLGGVALACTRSNKKQWRIVKEIHSGWQGIKRQSAERAIDSLYESRLIEIKKNRDGTHTLILSDNGKKRALRYQIHNMKIEPPRVWDQRWRIIIFDIPEHMRYDRDAFRDHLTRLGVLKLQQSVGVYPFDCKNEIDFIVELLDIRKYVRFITANHIDNETHLKRIFNLS